MKPILVLMRHAARTHDDMLSAEGHKQAHSLPYLLATELGRLIQNSTPVRELAKDGQLRLVSSPKNRTQSTLRFVTEATSVDPEISSLLDERSSSESQRDLEHRVKEILEIWTRQARDGQAPALTIACSHLDWLEAAVTFLDSDETDIDRSVSWPPMSARYFIFEDDIWRRKI